MRKVELYEVGNWGPTLEELNEALQVAETEHCMIRLLWKSPCNPEHHLDVKEGDNLQELQGKLPKRWSMKLC